MLKKHGYVGLSLLVLLLSLSLWALASCGGGGGGNSGGTQLTATQQAAASASAAQGAIALSASVAGSVDLASAYIPAGYAPGKGGLQAGTAAIANIDPRLRDVVDKMLVQMKRPAVKNTLSKAGTFNKVMSAPSVTTVICDSGNSLSGNYVVVDTVSSSGTATTHTLAVTYYACKDNSYADIINGSISATHTVDSVAGSESATVTITNLTDTTYFDTSYTQATDIFALNGTFTNVSTGNLSAGNASALGTFTWTMVDADYGNVVMTFNFGTGGTPITDTWTNVVSTPTTTEIHTANGTYGLAISAPGAQSIALGITLTALKDKYVTNPGGVDEWINGSVTIGWTPDLSQWGCLNGTYVFTTTTPIHTASLTAFCPSSGVVQVNNAKIEFGKPTGYNITVTLQPSGPSEVFTDCYSMGGGMCSTGGNATVPAPAVP
jgi:hypothetical protein